LLLAGHADTGELIYLGDVGTGFTDAARRHLLQVLRPLQRSDSPFPAEFLRARGRPERPPAHRGPVQWVEGRLGDYVGAG
jgi:ATP-dependent DNA ligase